VAVFLPLSTEKKVSNRMSRAMKMSGVRELCPVPGERIKT
jgi:hypothetical protein